MRLVFCAVAVMAVSAGCSGSTMNTSDGGTTDGGKMGFFEFDVSGSVSMFPDALDASVSIAGLTLRVEEPFKVALDDPFGVFSEQVADSSGTFQAMNIGTDQVSVGVAVGVRETAGTTPTVIRSATIVWDVAFEGKKPDRDLSNVKAYVVPKTLHEKLTQAVTPQRIAGLAPDAGTLIEAGFILGKVVDAQNQPVANVTVEPIDANKAPRFFYPTADFSGVGSATSSNGLFIYVHHGGMVQPAFGFNVSGRSEYKQRSAGAAKDAALVLIVFPGSTPPP